MKFYQLILTSMASALMVLALPSLANSPEQQGLAIVTEAKARDAGWQDSTANMEMILRNREGQESTREIEIKSLEQLNDGDKGLTIFNKPADVKGTAFLSFSHAVGADEQWLYLPALKRVKRIASKNKSGPFMGSEFAYEDLSSFEIPKYSYKYVGDEVVHELASFMVEQTPVDEDSGYTKRIVWLDKTEYRVQKIEFYDRKNSLLKTLNYGDYRKFLGKYWRAMTMHMENHQNGKSTDLRWDDYQFQVGLSDGDFNQNSLKRAH
jgi:outer membrane lipoprotein-sorting protein